MKKLLLIVFLCCVLTVTGCSHTAPEESSAPTTAQPPTETTPETISPIGDGEWSRKIKITNDTSWSSPVVETEEAFYYITGDSVYRYGKSTQEDRVVIPEPASGLALHEDKLYFHTEQEVKCMDLRTQNVSAVWDPTMLPDELASYYGGEVPVYDFALQDGYLYIRVYLSAIQICLETGETERLIWDFNKLVLLGENCYYTDHAERTFSLYYMNRDTREVTLLRGEGYSMPDPSCMRVDDVANVGETIYYSVRDASDIYRYDPNGSDEKIFDGDDSDDFWVFFVKRCSARNLYFYTSDGAQIKLYEYRPSEGAILRLTMDNRSRMCDFAVTESAIFWWSAKERAVVCMVNESGTA